MDNNEEIDSALTDDQEFEPLTPEQVFYRKKGCLYFFTWFVALISLSVIECSSQHLHTLKDFVLGVLGTSVSLILISWTFPLGLFGVFKDFLSRDNGSIALFVGWLIYITHAFITLTSKKKSTFAILMVIFALLLSLNIYGCSSILKEVNKIH